MLSLSSSEIAAVLILRQLRQPVQVLVSYIPSIRDVWRVTVEKKIARPDISLEVPIEPGTRDLAKPATVDIRKRPTVTHVKICLESWKVFWKIQVISLALLWDQSRVMDRCKRER